MADTVFDADGNPVDPAVAAQAYANAGAPPAPATPAPPMNPEDAELLQQTASIVPPAPQPIPSAAETHDAVANLGNNVVPSVDPTLNFKATPQAPHTAKPNELANYDTEKAKLDAEAIKNSGDVTDQAKAHADAEDQNARDMATNSALEAQDRADFSKKWNDNHDKLEQHYQDIENKYLAALEDNSHPKDFFTGKSTLQKFGALFGLALGTLGAGSSAASGNPQGNGAMIQLQKQMDAEHQRQKETVEGLDHASLRALTHISDDNAARQVAQTDLAAQWTAMRSHMVDEGTARLKALGWTDAQIAGNVELNQLKAKNAQDKFTVHQAYDKQMSEMMLQRGQTAAAYGAAKKDAAESNLYNSKASEDIAASKKAKADEDANNKVLSTLTKDPTYKSLIGTASRPGYIPVYQTLHQMSGAMHEAIASGDPVKMRAALNNAEESITKNNIGVAPSKANYDQFGQYAGLPQETMQKLQKLMGTPRPSIQEMNGLAEQLDQAANDVKVTKIDSAHKTLVNTHLTPGMHEPNLQRNYGTAIAAPFDGVMITGKDGKEVPAFRNDFNPSASAPPEPAQPDLRALAVQALTDPKASAEDKAAAATYLAKK